VAYFTELSYGRGALLLTALEDRIGKPRMLELLRDFHCQQHREARLLGCAARVGREGRRPRRRHLAATWLGRTGAPELRVIDGVVSAGRLHARVLCQIGSA